jgi:hypothetical protein
MPRQMKNGALWGKKEKACTDEEKEDHGDQWDHVVIDAESKAVISMVFCFGYRVARSGKRTKENTEELIQDLASRSLRVRIRDREYNHQSPMMALGVTQHIWSVEEMATYQTIADH